MPVAPHERHGHRRLRPGLGRATKTPRLTGRFAYSPSGSDVFVGSSSPKRPCSTHSPKTCLNKPGCTSSGAPVMASWTAPSNASLVGAICAPLFPTCRRTAVSARRICGIRPCIAYAARCAASANPSRPTNAGGKLEIAPRVISSPSRWRNRAQLSWFPRFVCLSSPVRASGQSPNSKLTNRNCVRHSRRGHAPPRKRESFRRLRTHTAKTRPAFLESELRRRDR